MGEPQEVYIGVDIGGTKVAAGLVNSAGRNPAQDAHSDECARYRRRSAGLRARGD